MAGTFGYQPHYTNCALRRNKVFIIFCAIVLVSSCAREVAKKDIAAEPPAYKEQQETVTKQTYKTGDVQQANVGERMLRRKSIDTTTREEFLASATQDIIVSSTMRTFTLIAGKKYPVIASIFLEEGGGLGREPERTHYQVVDVYDAERHFGLLVNDIGVLSKHVLLGNTLLPEDFSTSPPMAVLHLAREKQPVNEKVKEDFELIYGGMSNGAIHISARDYASDERASGFVEQVSFPEGAETIRYKSLQIKVHSATKDAITFAVMDSYY